MKILMFRGIDTVYDNGFRGEDEMPYYAYDGKIVWWCSGLGLVKTSIEDATDHERFDYAEIETDEALPLFESVWGSFDHCRYPEGCNSEEVTEEGLMELLRKYGVMPK